MQSIIETRPFRILRRLFSGAARDAGEHTRRSAAFRNDPRSATNVRSLVRAQERAWQRKVYPVVRFGPPLRDLP